MSWMGLRLLVFALSATFMCASANAATNLFSFEVAGKRLSMPVPDGFCVPTGDAAITADVMAQADDRNLSLAMFVECSGNGDPAAIDRYTVVLAPKAAIGGSFDKAAALDQLASVASGPDAPRFDEKMADHVASRYEKVVGERIELTGSIGFAGRDTDCVYLAGRITSKDDPNGSPLLVAGCMTVIGNKILSVYCYDARPIATVAMLRTEARRLALSIQ